MEGIIRGAALGEHPPPQLQYQVTPTAVPYTDDPARPSEVTLMVSVHNATDRDVDCSRIVFVLPAGADRADLIADEHAWAVDASPAYGTPWSIENNQDGTFTARPQPPAIGLAAGDTIAFEFSRVFVSPLPGLAPLEVYEDSGELRRGHVHPGVHKIVPRLAITKFTANPVQVLAGGKVTLRWNSLGAAEAVLAWDGRHQGVDRNGTWDVFPQRETVYTLTVSGQGTTATAQITIAVTQVRILLFQPAPVRVPQGGQSVLGWEVANASIVLLDDEEVDAYKGTKIVTPSETRHYFLVAIGPAGTRTEVTTVVVKAVEIETFEADSAHVKAGEKVTLRWRTSWAIGATIEPGVGPVDGEGHRDVFPLSDTTYVLTAQGHKGPVKRTVAVSVESARIESLAVEPESIAPWESATLRWSTSQATACRISPGIGDVELSGERPVEPKEPVTYTLTAEGPNGPAMKTVTLDVRSVRITQAWGLYQMEDGAAFISWKTKHAYRLELRRGDHVVPQKDVESGIYRFTAWWAETWTVVAWGDGPSPVEKKVWVGSG